MWSSTKTLLCTFYGYRSNGDKPLCLILILNANSRVAITEWNETNVAYLEVMLTACFIWCILCKVALKFCFLNSMVAIMNHCVLILSSCQMVSGAATVNALKNAKYEMSSKYDTEHDFELIVGYVVTDQRCRIRGGSEKDQRWISREHSNSVAAQVVSHFCHMTNILRNALSVSHL